MVFLAVGCLLLEVEGKEKITKKKLASAVKLLARYILKASTRTTNPFNCRLPRQGSLSQFPVIGARCQVFADAPSRVRPALRVCGDCPANPHTLVELCLVARRVLNRRWCDQMSTQLEKITTPVF